MAKESSKNGISARLIALDGTQRSVEVRDEQGRVIDRGTMVSLTDTGMAIMGGSGVSTVRKDKKSGRLELVTRKGDTIPVEEVNGDGKASA